MIFACFFYLVGHGRYLVFGCHYVVIMLNFSHYSITFGQKL